MKLIHKTCELAVFLLFLWAMFLLTAFARGEQSTFSRIADFQYSSISLKHFNHLFSSVVGDGKKMAIVHIYSEYPDYNYAGAPDEGIACVDDAARAIVMLADYEKIHHDGENLRKIKLLVEFILYMQNDNGYFNNFVWSDMSINTRYKTSRAEMNWWSFRALWSLEIAYKLFPSDTDMTKRIAGAIDRLMVNITRDISSTSLKTTALNGIKLPAWLPNGSAADQSAIAIIALLPHYKRIGDGGTLAIINTLAQGIMQMQKGDATHYPYGMFLSWRDEWHAWGNSQTYALLLAGQQLDHPEYIKSALREIDNFYPYLAKKGFFSSISIARESGRYVETGEKKFPQIAYGIRPMVYALSEACNITGNKKYIRQLAQLKAWFLGDNVAEKIMYNPESGRTYDAINSATKINMNSGAESTIEGLLALLR